MVVISVVGIGKSVAVDDSGTVTVGGIVDGTVVSTAEVSSVRSDVVVSTAVH